MANNHRILLGMLAVLLFLGWCLAQEPSATQPSTQQSQPSWRLTINRDMGEGNEGSSRFIVTVVNTGQTEQSLYTPGVVGPTLWPNFPGAALEEHVGPRPKTESARDFVSLRPGEGFSRISTALSARQLESISAVSAYFMIYEIGFEGYSQKVAKVINAPRYELTKTAK